MAELVCLVMFLQLIILAESSHTLPPTSFNFTTLLVEAANGSSAVGGCSSVTINRDRTSTCNNPASSVLFDRRTPTLAALDGDTWARQLMILYTPDYYFYNFNPQTSHSIDISYATSTGRRRVEVTIFNCPQWGTGVRYIRVYQFTTSYQHLETVYPTVISCTSLLRVCIPFQQTTTSTRFRLRFERFYYPVQHVHIAEISFQISSTPCPLHTTIPGTWTPPPPNGLTTVSTAGEETTSTTWMPHSAQTEETSSAGDPNVTPIQTTKQDEDPQLTADKAQGSLQVEFKDSSLMAVIAVFAAIMTLQTTVIFIVVIVIACRRKNSTVPTEKLTTTTTTDNIGGVYETVDIEMAPEYPAHGRNAHGHGRERGRGRIDFKKNESYEIPK